MLAEVRRGELLPTPSFSRRSWQWLPAEWEHADHRDGTLVILMTTDGRRRVRTGFFWYAVQVEWEWCDPDAGVWSFLLENEREPDEFGPFRCLVGGMVAECGCEAGWFDRPRIVQTSCKHRDALSSLVREGGL